MKKLRFGLTGGIATGKTTVAKIFESLGAVVIDTDVVVHQLLQDKNIICQIIKSFGENILCNDGTINKQLLAGIVFKQKGELEKLNNILHPRVIEILDSNWQVFQTSDDNILIEVVPLLYEVGIEDKYSKIMVVDSTIENQISRSISSKGWDKSQVLDRIAVQMKASDKIKKADFIINNNDSFEELKDKVYLLWQKLKKI